MPRRGFTPQGGINFDSPAAKQQKRKIPKGIFLFCDYPQVLLFAPSHIARKGECEGGTLAGSPARVQSPAHRRPLLRSKSVAPETKPPLGVALFLVQHFCFAKVGACGRVTERERGNPLRFPPHTPPSLRYARVRTTRPEGNHKRGRYLLVSSSFAVLPPGSRSLYPLAG